MAVKRVEVWVAVERAEGVREAAIVVVVMEEEATVVEVLAVAVRVESKNQLIPALRHRQPAAQRLDNKWTMVHLRRGHGDLRSLSLLRPPPAATHPE